LQTALKKLADKHQPLGPH